MNPSADDFFSSELEKLKAGNLYREQLVFEETDGRTVTVNGKKYLLFCSNDYLGLAHNRKVLGAVREGLERYGFGSGASRLVSGTCRPHTALEKKISRFLKREATLIFGSGYSANIGAIPALAGKGDVILADKLNHASLVDACLLSRAEFRRYPHRDMRALEKLLLRHKKSARNIWIATDGLFSMEGDLAPLTEICGLAKKYSASVYLDDAHAFGIYGANGRGSAEYFNVEDGVDILMGTLGKAAGGFGAFISGSSYAMDYLANKARTFIFSTAMPTANALGAEKAVDILSDFDQQRKMFWNITKAFHSELGKTEFEISSESYIIPLVVGGAAQALKACGSFWSEGVCVRAIRPPTVPEGSARLRVTLSLSQTGEDRQKVLGLIRTKKKLPE